MNKVWKAGAMAMAFVFAPALMAEEAAPDEATEAAADAPVVQVTPMGDQVVTVNSGNETVDAAANYAVKCTEKAGAMRACDQMGGFKAIGCRKIAEMRYKGIECPIQ